MLKAAVQSAKEVNESIKVLGVTVLTSLDEIILRHMGIREDIQSFIEKLAGLAYESGCDGIVCSAQDLSNLRPKFKPPFLMVTPAIRLQEDLAADQKRVATPSSALEAGADFLVIGRSITTSLDPKKAINALKV